MGASSRPFTAAHTTPLADMTATACLLKHMLLTYTHTDRTPHLSPPHTITIRPPKHPVPVSPASPPPQARSNLSASTARVWMKSALVEREAGDAAAQRRLLEEGLKRFNNYWKLWMMLGQVGGGARIHCVAWWQLDVFVE